MRMRTFRVITLVALCLGLGVMAMAQDGMPLKGTWSGDWGTNKTKRNRILMELDWDGKTVTGTLNPGENAVTWTKITYEPGTQADPGTWPVHFEGDGKDASGAPVHIVLDGKMSNLGSYNRVINGTWTQGKEKGDVHLTRN
jgi:hypothetical protein